MRPRFFRWVWPLAAVAMVLSLWATRAPQGKWAHAECLVSADCLSSERCVVKPSPDGFASAGHCGEPCAEDLQCEARWRCEALVQADGFVTTPGAPGATAEPVKICVPGARP
jgi:hypothetical protein